jgi:hypothetical protein
MKLHEIIVDTGREPGGMGITTAKTHAHMFVGVEVTFTLEPPFVEVLPKVGMSKAPEEGPMSKHEHELIDIPSLEAVEEQLLPPSRFSAHSHMYEAEGIGITGAGTVTGTLTPPPIPFE